VTVVSATAGIAALGLIAVTVTRASGAENAARSASVTTSMKVGGWGRGGYPMVTTAGNGAGPAVNGTANAAQISVNWSGYVATGTPGQFTSVSTSWTQPAVTCGAANTSSSFWAGLDGDGTNTVEQTGTEADCANGAATYAGWWEMFPNAPVFYNNPVQPGDSMTASVKSDGNGNFTLTLSDTSQGWSQSTQQANANAQLGSAEVIAEAPSDGTVLPLSNFGTVTFGNDAVNGAAIGNSGAAPLTMVSQNGVTEATPSALAGGNSFTVTWDNDGVTGTGAGATAPAATATAPAATASTPPATASANTSPSP
jgi:peptidase A4-like protein